ncbi:TipAS antibiotic-recognition domain-containing protein [Actinomycetospora sp. NBRC 106378]|uniref:TipAS antibiotic-recognition domain-containing protein n=1 Tax=Actinomycetospora sp. NBRC 106378 TaxID=3032208 RepID=UPI0024A3C216|nr:TipAS antibiotic-recognition domain-containing protein [Actinomycetospora sp. NBRC 106378]GLZ54844.1 hypothetical protein Acsp07_44610 [Actinomycetospora sp. NBRC 106378]
MDGSSAAEVARASGVPLAALRPGLWTGEDVVELQRVLLCRELGLAPDKETEHADRGCASAADLLPLLEAVRARVDRQIASVRAVAQGRAVTPEEILDGFGERPRIDEDLDELGLAWARAWTAGEPVDSPAARSVADRHRALAGPVVSEALAAVLDRHAAGVAAYARDALSGTG